jgi:hypothetical protein
MKNSRFYILLLVILFINVLEIKPGYAQNPGKAAEVPMGKPDSVEAPNSDTTQDLIAAPQKDSVIYKTPISDSLRVAIAKKPSPTGALLRTAFIPGSGQIYNKQYIKAVAYGSAEIILGLTTARYWRQLDLHQRNFTLKNISRQSQVALSGLPTQNVLAVNASYRSQEFTLYENAKDSRNLYLWLTGLTLFVSMFDAYVDAQFSDFNQTDKAFEAQLYPRNDGLYLAVTYNLK